MGSSTNKRQRLSSPGEDYVSLAGPDVHEQAQRYGYNHQNNTSLPTGPRATQQRGSDPPNAWNDPRNAKDRPKSKHPLPDFDPWILVKTKYGRRFVHNLETRESFWRIPQDLLPAVRDVDELEREQKEKEANARWAEEQLKDMRQTAKAEEINRAARHAPENRRRRSESLQREDEAAMLTELAAEAERAEMEDVEDVVKEVETLKPIAPREVAGYGSDSSYEEVEVTDSEFEDDDVAKTERPTNGQETEQQPDDGPVECGEDDIAYQLAAMEQDYNSGSGGSYDEAEDDLEDDEGEHSNARAEAIVLFREMLNEHGISPFTPWDKLLLDESDNGIIMDDRYTALPNMKSRKEVWEVWVKDTAARLKEERERTEQLDPKIPYLAFLADKATPKLYWPEFKRKYRKEAEMNDRKLNDKDRERLYRDHINRLKLPEKTRKADLIALLNSVPLRLLNRDTSLDALPQPVSSHLHYISLLKSARDETIRQHIAGLPVGPDDDDESHDTEARHAASAKKRVERERQEKALAERAEKVDEDRRKADKEERWARRDLRAEEQELRRAMDVGRGAVPAQLRDG